MIFIRKICNEYAERIAKAKENGRNLAIEQAPLIAETVKEEFFCDADEFEIVVTFDTCFIRDSRGDARKLSFKNLLFTEKDEMIVEECEEFRNAYIEQLCEELHELKNATMERNLNGDKFVISFGRDFIINFNALQEVYNKN